MAEQSRILGKNIAIKKIYGTIRNPYKYRLSREMHSVRHPAKMLEKAYLLYLLHLLSDGGSIAPRRRISRVEAGAGAWCVPGVPLTTLSLSISLYQRQARAFGFLPQNKTAE